MEHSTQKSCVRRLSLVGIPHHQSARCALLAVFNAVIPTCMKFPDRSLILGLLASAVASGCTSAIVDSQSIKTSANTFPPKGENSPIEIVFSNQPLTRQFAEVGNVTSRAWVLEKGVNALKSEARKLGADAVVNVKYERKMSIDYGQDLFTVEGNAVVWR